MMLSQFEDVITTIDDVIHTFCTVLEGKLILEKCLFLTKNSLLKIYFKEDQNFNATITFHLLGQYSFILVYIFSQHNPIEGWNYHFWGWHPHP